MAKTIDPLIERFRTALRDTPEDVLHALAYGSPAAHFALFAKIRDKDNNLIQPHPNILQLRMSEAYEAVKARGAKVRIICVKPRRAGCSSFASHIVYHHARVQPIEGITISDVRGHSAELMDKLKDMDRHDSFPWGQRPIQDSAHSLAWSNGTKWTIDSAENPDAGVGGTRQAGHFSEVAKWPQTATRNDRKTMAAVLPSLSGQNTVCIAESTPEGAQGWMYETWQQAKTLDEWIAMWDSGIRPDEVWVKVFAAWFEFADNRRTQPVTDREWADIEADMDDDERDLIEKYDLDREQVAWRRDTIKAVCGGDPKVFRYYYPSDDVTCWLASGRPRFDMQALVEMEVMAKAATPDVGFLVRQEVDNRYVFQRDQHGDIFMWEVPTLGLRYLIVCDPASDESQTIGADPDRHSVLVWRAGYFDSQHNRYRLPKIVARVRPPYYADGDQVAGHIARLSKFYGQCIAAIEVNCGLDIIRQCRDAGVPLYKRRPLSHRTNQIVLQDGFRMGDKQERNALIEGFAAAVREKGFEPTCPHVIAECKAFIVLANGRAEAAPGHHDDDVLASCIAWECMPSATELTQKKIRIVDPPDRGAGGWRTVSNVRRGW